MLSEPSEPAGPGTSDGETNFGFRRVAARDHARLVGGVFASVADRYDLMNDLMSGGLHRLWKRALIDRLAPRPGMRLLDVAGGTGDIATRFSDRLGGRAGLSVVCDPSEAMLAAGRRRVLDRGMVSGIDFLCARAEALPIAGRAVDACTISFGLRNVSDRAAALVEMRRVLDYGGHFLCLEFSPAVLPALAGVYQSYSFRVLPWMGERVTGDRAAYQYLAESIRRFPEPGILADEMRNAGFGNVTWQALSGGIVAIHSGWRV